MDKSGFISGIFTSVSSKYDLMNNIMSFGWHHVWKAGFVKMLHLFPGIKVLDSAGGTGDIAIRILCKSPEASLCICDNNIHMLERCRNRMINFGSAKNVDWVCADAEFLPFKDNAFDLYTISFGLRNTYDLERTIEESIRTLKPGGQFACLEFSPELSTTVLDKMYKLYLSKIIPRIGKFVTGDYEAYKYLSDSIINFHTPSSLVPILEAKGYKKVLYQSLSNGIAVMYTGYKES